MLILELVQELLFAGTRSRIESIATLREAFPEASKSGIETFLSDLPNPKYTFWKDRSVVKSPEGKLQFADTVHPFPKPQANDRITLIGAVSLLGPPITRETERT